MTLVVWLPSDAVSSIPVSVTVCGVSQFELVNVSAAGETVTSPVSADDSENTTFPVGSESRTTVNVAVDPFSDTDAVVPDRVNPETSSSVVLPSMFPSARESQASWDAASLTATMTSQSCLSSSRSSSTLETVTVWAVSQLEPVKVSVAVETVASVVSVDVTSNTTFPAGAVSRTTVNVPVLPPSARPMRLQPLPAHPEVIAVVKAGARSTSVVVTLTVWSASESKSSSDEPSLTDRVTVVVWSPSSRRSGMPVTVIVWAVSQLLDVNVSDEADTVASPVSLLDTSMTTSDDGSPVSTTVKVCVEPDSDTVREDSDTLKPGVPQLVAEIDSRSAKLRDS